MLKLSSKGIAALALSSAFWLGASPLYATPLANAGGRLRSINRPCSRLRYAR
jgi:hypothetical protein